MTRAQALRRPPRLLSHPLVAVLLALAALLVQCRPVVPPVLAAPPQSEAAAGPRFFAVGDTGTGGPDQHRVAAAIRGKCAAAGCDFGVLLGDNFYPDGVESAEDPQWATKFEQPYAAILAAEIPFYAVLGNHDYADGRDFARGAHQVAYGQAHALWRMPDAYYTFESGSALFFALDTTALEANRPGAEPAQERMVAAAMAANKRPWVLALGHHPYLSNGTNGNARGRLARFLAGEVCGRADVYLAGHDHNLQVLPASESCKSLSVVAGGGGYATYALPGGNPSLFQAEVQGFVYVAVEPARLTLEVVDAEGQTLFSHTLTK